MKKIIYFFFFFVFTVFFNIASAKSDYSIIFIHIGKTIPPHVPIALAQARLFNQDCPIILAGNQEAMKDISLACAQSNVTFIALESLVQTEEHKKFRQLSGLDNKWHNGFWLYTSERFLYLQDLILQYDLTNIFHLEHDNMLYANLNDILSVFENDYPGLGLTMHNDQVCIPGFVYIADKEIITQLAFFFAENASKNQNDMQILGSFKSLIGHVFAKNLPIIFEEYALEHPLKSMTNQIPLDPSKYFLNINQFNSIFDAAALGQYLGGIDPIHGQSEPGFINESCIFNPSYLNYKWVIDLQGRRVPFIKYKDKYLRINNLHIHSKNLKPFASSSFE
ncbi:MAG: hypothetical protein ACH350_07340 [Parachlamydiaceae bacterium]